MKNILISIVVMLIEALVAGVIIFIYIKRNKALKENLKELNLSLASFKIREEIYRKSIKSTAVYIENKKKTRTELEKVKSAIQEAEDAKQIYKPISDIVDRNNSKL